MATSVAIHQPNYIPWLGFFNKMMKSDIFVFLDTVQYPRGQSFAARNRIKTAQGAAFLTIPVSTPSGRQGKILYTDIKYANNNWRTKHLKTLEKNYKRSAYFDPIYTRFQEVILQKTDFLATNMNIIEMIIDYLNIDTQCYRLSRLLDHFGQKTDLIINICQALEANIYLSGDGGGKEYNDPQLMQTHGIELQYLNFKHPVYEQLWGDFIPNLSILDLLFNHGPKSKEILTHA